MSALTEQAHYPRNRLEPEILRDRLLDALETIMAFDDCPEFRVVARRRYIELTETRNDA
jgi:hypothetical protein